TAKILGEEYYCLADSYEDYYILGIYPYYEMFANRNSTALLLIFCNLLVFIIVFLLISGLLQKLVISGIYTINGSLDKITNGELEEKVNVQTTQEFCSLSNGINSTVSALKQAINDAATRLDRELELAKAIQASALPRVFPPYPEHDEFNIYASMVPAKEVGGDFYDFFLIDENHLAVVIADVSGKGIPAALFMMTAKTLLKNLAETGLPPEEILNLANDHLCLNNDAGMFVTVWLGIWEISSGKLSYANAGHNYPIYYKKAQGQFEFLKAKSGFVLAGMEGFKYRRQEIQTTPGDILFLYTDGVTENSNAQEEPFGEERLLEVLNQHKNNSIKGILQMVSQSLDDFRQEAAQFDDITMLGLQINNFNQAEEGKIKRLALPAKISELDNLLNFVREELQKVNCPNKTLFQLEMVCEEVFVNIAKYAYGPQEKQPLAWCDLSADEKGVIIVFTDRGRQFNPLNRQDPDLNSSLEDKPIGGLGIFLTKKNMDLVEYTYRFGRNILTLHKKF
ncbi:MAG: SpoIIE family protein phosphatase, partial [Clostridia bacterium]|nr:SpoIIE family protein phosphatase [Clostridia bacterium]